MPPLSKVRRSPRFFPTKQPHTIIDVRALLKEGVKHSSLYFSASVLNTQMGRDRVGYPYRIVPYRTFLHRFGSARARYYRARAVHSPCTVRYDLFCERGYGDSVRFDKCTVRFDKCTVRLADERCNFMLGTYLMNNRRSLFLPPLQLPCD